MFSETRHFLHSSIWLVLSICLTTGELVAKNSGIQEIKRNDVGIVFYVEIKNEAQQWCAINVRMIKCCETICPSDVECEHMQLIGGDMGTLAPKASRNLTLVWPTLYHHDRVGECMIAIGYITKNNRTGEIHQNVKFDTTVSSRFVRPILQGYYGTGDIRKCSTVDLDTLDNCRPVNCHVKYNGKRNFFNRRQQRCQSVPVCIADTTKELPDVAYVPASNICRDLENAVDDVEVRALSQGIAESAWRSEPLPYLSNVHCHHGSTDNTTGFCICHDGWTSEPIDNLTPSTEMINLCNVQMLYWPRSGGSRLKSVSTLIAAFLGVLLVLFCCAMAYVMRVQPAPSPEDASNCGGNRDVLSSCPLTSDRSHGTCTPSRPYKRFCEKTFHSDTSCSVNRRSLY